MHTLNFEPQHHAKVDAGPSKGAWLPLIPPASAETDVFVRARLDESHRLQAQGASIVIVGTSGDSSTVRAIEKTLAT